MIFVIFRDGDRLGLEYNTAKTHKETDRNVCSGNEYLFIMSRLIMVRHAQASFGKADYDQLSELGHKQARALGDFFAETTDVSRVYCGPLKRHRQTMEWVYGELRLLGVKWPEPQFLDGLVEHRGPSVLKALLPSLMETDEKVRQWGQELETSNGKSRKVHLKIFEYVMREWAADRLDDSHLGYQTWAEFCRDVKNAINRMLDQAHPEETIVAFSSGGTMSAAVGHALQIPDPETVIGLHGLVYNTAISEFQFSDGKLNLKSFNTVPHLSRKELLTYV